MIKALDLFCGAGGASRGYQQAGFHVTGVDINPQPNYAGDVFIQHDFSTISEVLDISSFDFVHASPPCQRYSTMTKRHVGRPDTHPEFIEPTRQMLNNADVPYVIENVQGSPLHSPIVLCGSMFGLEVRRHRLFESNFLLSPPSCDHKSQGKVIGVYGHTGGSSKRDGITFGSTEDWRRAMGIDWMTAKEMAESIPPAYTKWIGAALLDEFTNSSSVDLTDP